MNILSEWITYQNISHHQYFRFFTFIAIGHWRHCIIKIELWYNSFHANVGKVHPRLKLPKWSRFLENVLQCISNMNSSCGLSNMGGMIVSTKLTFTWSVAITMGNRDNCKVMSVRKTAWIAARIRRQEKNTHTIALLSNNLMHFTKGGLEQNPSLHGIDNRGKQKSAHKWKYTEMLAAATRASERARMPAHVYV